MGMLRLVTCVVACLIVVETLLSDSFSAHSLHRPGLSSGYKRFLLPRLGVPSLRLIVPQPLGGLIRLGVETQLIIYPFGGLPFFCHRFSSNNRVTPSGRGCAMWREGKS